MVRIIFVILAICSFGKSSAQDLIVKRTGEKIFCNIEKITDFYIHFYEIEDIEKSLLYKMDVALVEKVSFANMENNLEEKIVEITESDQPLSKMSTVESNLDGFINQYFSIHYQFVDEKYAFDLGFKRFTGRVGGNSIFTSDDTGSMVELGFSLPVKMFGSQATNYRGFYIRGFGIYTKGTFRNLFNDFSILSYAQTTFGLQAVLAYQLSKRVYFRLYYGLGGTVETTNFGPRTKQADVSAPEGVQTISGLRIGYIF